jgi:hypothetical protein
VEALKLVQDSKEEIMRSLRFSRAFAVCGSLAILLLVTQAATTRNGRDFTGYYDVSNVREQGDSVQATLHLKLFNHGSTDVKSVIVTLVDPTPSMILRGSFQPVKVWKSQQFIEMSQEFTVTKHEFAEWMAPPAQPNLIILFQDSNGKNWQRGAQLSHRLLAH